MATDSTPDGDVERRCRDEIVALHDFFEAWLSGTRPDTDRSFDRVRQALASDFQLIHPEGRWMTRTDILDGLRTNHGSQPDLTIEIRNVRVLDGGETLIVATYEEWQTSDEATDGRQSTVVFARDADAPHGLRWQHVHETWIETAL